MTDGIKVKHTAKDSVFTDLFSIPKYLLELYQALHPEDKTTTVKDLKSVTCQCILAGHPYNDLGFNVRNRLIVLQSPHGTGKVIWQDAQSDRRYFAHLSG